MLKGCAYPSLLPTNQQTKLQNTHAQEKLRHRGPAHYMMIKDCAYPSLLPTNQQTKLQNMHAKQTAKIKSVNAKAENRRPGAPLFQTVK